MLVMKICCPEVDGKTHNIGVPVFNCPHVLKLFYDSPVKYYC